MMETDQARVWTQEEIETLIDGRLRAYTAKYIAAWDACRAEGQAILDRATLRDRPRQEPREPQKH